MNIRRRLKSKDDAERRLMGADSRQAVSLRKYSTVFAFICLLALIITFLFPRGKSFEFADLREGQVYIGEEIIAPFTFPVLKSHEEYQQDVLEAKADVVPVFSRTESISQEQINHLVLFTDRLKLLLKSRVTTRENLKELFNEARIVCSDEDLFLLLTGFQFDDANSISVDIKSVDVNQRVTSFQEIVNHLIPQIQKRFAAGILDLSKSELSSKSSFISIRKEGQESKESLQFYQDLPEAKSMLLTTFRSSGELDERKIKIAYNIANYVLVPNVLYNREETEARINDRVQNVPLAKDQVLDGERIIDSHQRLTRQHIEKLNSLSVAKAEKGEFEGFWSSLTPNIGKFLLVLSILAILVIYLFKDQEEIFNDHKKMLLIGLNLLFLAIITFFTHRFSLSPNIIPIATVSIIITIFFDARVGLFVTLTASLLIGAMRGNEFSVVFSSLFCGVVAVQTVRKVRTRNWIVQSGAYIGVAYVVVILISNMVAYGPFMSMLKNWGIGILNGFLAPGLAYLLIIILESAFDLTTDMTLIELSDFNHPLLRQLHLEAPGTYHHSYLVGLLADAATEELGGNGLLARVGAYYHDIGKLDKPEYFVENQTRGRNPQENLTPTMSSLILANHVRRGAEIAREYGLPQEIEAFIHQHHGTSLMSFFYQKALELNNNENVSQNEFRYPGPRPQTRETAIVMLADVVEASSRTLKDPTPSKIKNLVEQIINERFKSGELDDSPLTLRDLSKIVNIFHKVLIGRFHGRIEYPETNNETPKKQKMAN
ncbi:MAG: HDIG domain-containing protein [Calditrichaeota bacterium]|nr:MAG: HDIG domain-containing protein [Calditrichota bacterium]